MKKPFIAAAAAAIALSGAAFAQEDDEGPFARQIEARQGIMNYFALNLGVLGAMAKGEADYDAAAARKAAENLVAASGLDMSMLWPAGSDNVAHKNTAALPALWAEGADVGAKAGALKDAALRMQEAAGTDLVALQGAMEGLGAACTGCHKPFRQAE